MYIQAYTNICTRKHTCHTPGLHAIWEVGKVLTQNQTLLKLYLPNTLDTELKHLIGTDGAHSNPK